MTRTDLPFHLNCIQTVAIVPIDELLANKHITVSQNCCTHFFRPRHSIKMYVTFNRTMYRHIAVCYFHAMILNRKPLTKYILVSEFRWFAIFNAKAIFVVKTIIRNDLYFVTTMKFFGFSLGKKKQTEQTTIK